ncbi:cardiolipin synthase [Weissella halotolerans]|nr:cardiolipin synthase [Weissella halotolerans]
MIVEWTTLLNIIVIINAGLAIFTVFRQPRDIAATWAWLLLLVFLPILGFFIYSFFGRRLPKKTVFPLPVTVQERLQRTFDQQKSQLGRLDVTENPNNALINDASGMAEMFMNIDTAPLLGQNEIETFTGGKPFMEAVLKDIDQAKQSIHIEFYTFYADKIGQKVLDHLVAKAKAGVAVRVLYDSWGSMGTTKQFFQPLFDAGGWAYPFLRNELNVIDMRANFRDHHKIITIDGTYGYIGGLNIGDQYMGWDPKFGNWRDCSIRIHGQGVHGLQTKFLTSWNATVSEQPINPATEAEWASYYPTVSTAGQAVMQIVSSGPDSSMEQIKMGYLKLIQLAKHSIKITTPYLIPDPSVLDALKIAVKSGVQVEIVTPDMPDHPFVYRATQYYSWQLSKLGIKVYAYNKGFMHAKTIVVDGKYVSVGSANLDYRSFELNFEANAFVYDETLARQMVAIFAENIADSTLQTDDILAAQSLWLTIKQHFSRLLSPLL